MTFQSRGIKRVKAERADSLRSNAVMVEAMTCGTPVIAFKEGAARELVTDGETGLLVRDEAEMAAAVARIDRVDPVRCRATIAARCDAPVVARAYESAYQRAIREFAAKTPAPRLTGEGRTTVHVAVDQPRRRRRMSRGPAAAPWSGARNVVDPASS